MEARYPGEDGGVSIDDARESLHSPGPHAHLWFTQHTDQLTEEMTVDHVSQC